MRYHLHGHFVEEQRRGFPVHHEIDKYTDDFFELASILNLFTKDYNPTYCYGLAVGISEESSLVD